MYKTIQVLAFIYLHNQQRFVLEPQKKINTLMQAALGGGQTGNLLILSTLTTRMSVPYKKLDKKIDELSVVCRGCLASSGEMKNMHEWALVQDYLKFTGVQVQMSDGVSALLCTACEQMLKKCKDFKAQCQQSDVLLKDAQKHSKSPSTTESLVASISFEMVEHGMIVNIIGPDVPESKINLQCPYDSPKCNAEFTKKRHLLSHMMKNHDVNADFLIQLKYFCCYENCPYNLEARAKCFTERKHLNQHYLKVHRTKLIVCQNCDFSCATASQYKRHSKVCNNVYFCQECDTKYKTHETYLVHLMRKHPTLHERYKTERRQQRKRSSDLWKYDFKIGTTSPKRSLATQTLSNVPVSQNKQDAMSTQTIAEDTISLRSDDLDSIFLGSVTDIQTQTFPMELGLNRSHKETLTSRSQSPDLSIKETQTCFCLYDSQNCRLFEGAMSSPSNLVSSETQTADLFPYTGMDLT